MEDAKQLITILKGTSKVEFNNLNNVLSWNEVAGKENIYFVAGLDKKLSKRCNDDDIVNKKYFVIDIDIRLDYYKKTNTVLTDYELLEHINTVVELITKAGYDDYSALVHSGNGLHIYYTGEERNFDKNIYSEGVQMIYEEINNIIQSTGYKCDPACHNISRIMRLPGTINPRYKELIVLDELGNKVKNSDGKIMKEIAYDLGPTECYVIVIEEKQSIFFASIEEYAEIYRIEKEQEKKDRIVIHDIVKKEWKKPSDVRSQINSIPACDIACDIRPVTMSDKGGDNVALKEDKKNMGAYRYRPNNVIVNTGSSMISTNKNYFTSYELIFYEYANQDKQRTLQYFKDKYNIEINDDKKEIEIVPVQYEKQGYVYGNNTFDPFDCCMSGELLVIVALSNTGKTTFAMDMISANVKLGKKCFYINLEFAIETVRQSRRLFVNGYKKRNLTDLDPLTPEAKANMDKYVDQQLKKFDSYSNPKGIELFDLVEMVKKKKAEGYGFIVVDTFSRIEGNLDSSRSHTSQNKAMQVLQDLCQAIGVTLVLLHHTNKKGEFEGSQKIMDLANVFIVMSRTEDIYGENKITKFTLTKDKFVSYNEIETLYEQGNYIPNF